MDNYTCGDCIWAQKHVDDGPMVICRLKGFDAYKLSVPCVDFERYEQPF